MPNRERSLGAADCDICEEALSATLDGEGVVYLVCGHVAHGECLIEHARFISTCSVCFHPIRVDSTRGRVEYAQKLKRSISEALNPLSAQSADLPLRETSSGQPLEPLEESHPEHTGSLRLTLTPEFPALSFSRSIQLMTVLVRVQACCKRSKKLPRVQMSSSLLSPPASPESNFSWVASPRTFGGSTFSIHTPNNVCQPLEHNAVAALLKLEMLEWHGLDPDRLGNLHAWDTIQVGARDEYLTQELIVYLFESMMICVKDRIFHSNHSNVAHKKILMGSIVVKRHLTHLDQHGLTLTLNLSVPELPHIYLHFDTVAKLDKWKGLIQKSESPILPPTYLPSFAPQAPSPVYRRRHSSSYSTTSSLEEETFYPLHLIIIYAIEDSTDRYKLALFRDTITFLLARMQSQDRLAIIPADNLESPALMLGPSWSGWQRTIANLGPVPKANLSFAIKAADRMMNKPLSFTRNSAIFIISDSNFSSNDTTLRSSVPTYTFGLGLMHKVQMLQEFSGLSGGIYTYLKDWCKLRECVVGCFGLVQSLTHHNVRVHLNTLDRAARFSKVSGATYASLLAGRTEADIYIGSLGPGQVREVLVQMVVEPHDFCQSTTLQDHWDSMLSGLGCSNSVIKSETEKNTLFQEINMLSVTAAYGDGSTIHSRDSLESAMLCMPIVLKNHSSAHLAHEAVIQRRVEVLCADVLQKTITLMDYGEAEKVKYLLSECQSILSDLERARYPSSDDDIKSGNASTRSGIDHAYFIALNSEIQGAYHGTIHEDLFAQDCKKHLTQCIHCLSQQIAVSTRSPLERHFASQLDGVDLRVEQSKHGHQPPVYGHF